MAITQHLKRTSLTTVVKDFAMPHKIRLTLFWSDTPYSLHTMLISTFLIHFVQMIDYLPLFFIHICFYFAMIIMQQNVYQESAKYREFCKCIFCIVLFLHLKKGRTVVVDVFVRTNSTPNQNRNKLNGVQNWISFGSNKTKPYVWYIHWNTFNFSSEDFKFNAHRVIKYTASLIRCITIFFSVRVFCTTNKTDMGNYSFLFMSGQSWKRYTIHRCNHKWRLTYRDFFFVYVPGRSFPSVTGSKKKTISVCLRKQTAIFCCLFISIHK